MSNVLFFISGLALGCFGSYCYRRRKLKESASGEKVEQERIKGNVIDEFVAGIEAEKVERLSLSDVVNYFKGLSLKKGVDTPFIAVANKDGVKSYLLACFNEETEEITNYRLLTPNSIDERLQEVLGDEKFVVLS